MQRQDELNTRLARSGISQVLSQARASLKNPSRPFTPRNEARTLFDSRPGSRSGSLQTLSETEPLGNSKPLTKPTRLAPSSTLIPPKPTLRKPSPPLPTSGSQLQQQTSSSPRLLHSNKPSASISEERDERDEDENQEQNCPEDPQEDVDHEEDQRDVKQSEEAATAELTRQIRAIGQLIAESIADASNSAESDPKSPPVASIASQQRSITLFKQLDGFLRDIRGCSLIHARLDAIDQAVELVLGDYLMKKWVKCDPSSSSMHAEDTLTMAPLVLELLLDHEETRLKHQVNRTFTSDQVQRMVALSKVLFTLSKQSDNDLYFCCVRLVESILGIASLHANTSSHTQSQLPLRMLMYLLASLKNVSIGQDKMVKLLATNGAIRVFSEYMQHVIRELQEEASADSMHALLASAREPGEEEPSSRKSHAQVMIQVTSILRNLSVKKAHFKQLSDCQVIDRLCALMQVFDAAYDMELVVNVFRILSKLTLHEVFRAQFNEHHARNLRCCMGVFMQKAWFASNYREEGHEQTILARSKTIRGAFHDTLFVRVGFTLGNLSASNDRNRMEMCLELDGVHWFLELLTFYGRAYAGENGKREEQRRASPRKGEEEEEQEGEDGEDASSKSQHEVLTPCAEVLVKLIRLIANVCINEQVALKFAQETTRLSWLVTVLEFSCARDDEELMLNTVSCLTNLCYFCTLQTRHEEEETQQQEYKMQDQQEYDHGSESKTSFIVKKRLEIARILGSILLHVNEEAIVEASRAFGNLSRFPDVLEYMQSAQVMNALVVLLDHSNREIVVSVCGVLMNATLHEGIRRWLLEGVDLDGDTVFVCDLLCQIIHNAVPEDLELALMASKVLYNLVCVGGAARLVVPATHHLDSQLVSLRNGLEQVSKHLDEAISKTSIRSARGDANKITKAQLQEQERAQALDEEDLAMAQEVASIVTHLLRNLIPKRISQ